MKIIGLTGTVASGKNFVASIFKKKGAAIFDADLEVHKIFSASKDSDQEIVKQIANKFPEAKNQDGSINRKILGKIVLNDHHQLKILEDIIHPEISKKETNFIKLMKQRKKNLVILNIPLLLEKTNYQRCDKIISVIISNTAQKYRFIKRHQPNNQDQKTIESNLNQIKNQQANNLQHKKKADFIIYNGISKAHTIRQVNDIYHKIWHN